MHSGQKHAERSQENGAGKTEFHLLRKDNYERIPVQDCYQEQQTTRLVALHDTW
jgi:hypothetical protein